MRYVFLRYPNGKAKAVTFSYDDGVVQDLLLAALFDRYGIKATFNFTSSVRFTKEEIEECFLSKGHEIATHCAHHRANGNLRMIEGIREVLDCRLALEEMCNGIIRGMAYPDTGITLMGNLEGYEKIKNYLTELDIAYARTLGGDNDSFLLPQDFHAWMPSAHHDNPNILDYIDSFLQVDTSANVYFSKRYPRLLYIWGHSFELDRKNNWEHMEDICQRLAGNESLWYATNIEIYDYVQAYKSLRYSANGRRIFNPTLLTVWLDVDGETYSIPSGETLLLPERH